MMNQKQTHSLPVRYNPCMKGSAGIFPEYEFEDPMVVNRLVNNLMYLFNVNDGDYLTFILGHGDCYTNKQAMQHWVYDQLGSSVIGHDDVLAFLSGQLQEQLMMEVCQ
jgi:hypothetical protein